MNNFKQETSSGTISARIDCYSEVYLHSFNILFLHLLSIFYYPYSSPFVVVKEYEYRPFLSPSFVPLPLVCLTHPRTSTFFRVKWTHSPPIRPHNPSTTKSPGENRKEHARGCITTAQHHTRREPQTSTRPIRHSPELPASSNAPRVSHSTT